MDNFIKKYKQHLLILIVILASVLRLSNLSGIPVSLFGDELDVGYHAYSILKTGKDYSGNFLPLHMQSLAEWRTPLYLYSTVPTVALFGITPLGVRLPAAIFGILGVYGIYLLVKQITKREDISLLSSLILAISPWHLQYSRGAFEVTMLLTFLIYGVYFFLEGLKEGKYLWMSVILLVLTPLIYSTAKLFSLSLLVFLFLLYKKDIFALKKKYLIWALLAGLIFGSVTSYATLFSGGGQRFGYIGIFTDPTVEPEVGVDRLRDARMRGEFGEGLQPTFIDRALHNKFVTWMGTFADNYIEAYSFDFLFSKGDPIPRHSLDGMGQFYSIELIAFVLGVVLFFTGYKDKRKRALIGFWLLTAAIPSAITRDGGNHATRLILMLPPMVFLLSYGVIEGAKLVKSRFRLLGLLGYFGLITLSFLIYFHQYTFHYPWDSERWWHFGWKEAINYVMESEQSYERVFITMADEPAWIFFAALSEYPPAEWHQGFPMAETEIEGFGGLSYIDKYYFGSPDEDGSGIYGLPNYISASDLYLASHKEVPFNLVMNPGKVPNGLVLLKSVTFPSGEPAFYLFTKE